MKRRDLLRRSAVLGLMTALPLSRPAWAAVWNSGKGDEPNPLKPPQGTKRIPVAFLISEDAVVIDFAGPWEVFHQSGFSTYTVAETPKSIQAMGGMRIIPNYTFAAAPMPKVLVIPAQNGSSRAMLDWIRRVSQKTDVTMSVCTGALILAATGLLNGKPATTHHASFKEMAMSFPEIQVKRGARFVEAGNLATSGGLSSGIDLALRVVERYYGREKAEKVAYEMEYQGQGWKDPNSNQVYAKARVSTADHPLCPVCEMDADPSSPTSVYKGKTYYFCMPPHKEAFDKSPEKYLDSK
ncbi:MAG TPA: DJ-1/PfpI family protein [Methylomirabilota bacterium]|nr:DJ-1/PfpI family protein [Methylomirabilota bacterium]